MFSKKAGCCLQIEIQFLVAEHNPPFGVKASLFWGENHEHDQDYTKVHSAVWLVIVTLIKIGTISSVTWSMIMIIAIIIIIIMVEIDTIPSVTSFKSLNWKHCSVRLRNASTLTDGLKTWLIALLVGPSTMMIMMITTLMMISHYNQTIMILF